MWYHRPVQPRPKASPVISVPPAAIIPIRSNWVRIDGNITSWGTQEVKGTLTVMAATTSLNGVPAGWFDSANAIWTNTTKIDKTAPSPTATMQQDL